MPVSQVQQSGRWEQVAQLEVGKMEEAVVCMSKTRAKLILEGLQRS